MKPIDTSQEDLEMLGIEQTNATCFTYVPVKQVAAACLLLDGTFGMNVVSNLKSDVPVAGKK